MEEHAADVPVFQRECCSGECGFSSASEFEARVFLRRTAAPVLQSLKETFEVVRWRNRVLACNVHCPPTQWHMVETLVDENLTAVRRTHWQIVASERLCSYMKSHVSAETEL